MSLIRKIIHRVYPPRHLAFYGQRLVLNPALRRRISALLATTLPAMTNPVRPKATSSVAELDSEGYCPLPGLVTKEMVGDIRRHLEGRLLRDRFRPDQAEFAFEDAPSTCHVAVYSDRELTDCPHLLRIANDPRVLEAVGGLFGCKPTISNMSLWWSLSGRPEPEDAEFFHRDVDDWHFVKLFVYLTDVDEGAGPHVFVSGSHNVPRLTAIRRYQDAEVETAFGRDPIRRMTGEAGTAFLENTFGVHKGQLATTTNRLLFQVQYSLFPVGVYAYAPRPRGQEHAHLDPYINRLYLS